MIIETWRKLYLSGCAEVILNKKETFSRETLIGIETADNGSNYAELAAKIHNLKLENDILRQTMEY